MYTVKIMFQKYSNAVKMRIITFLQYDNYTVISSIKCIHSSNIISMIRNCIKVQILRNVKCNEVLITDVSRLEISHN